MEQARRSAVVELHRMGNMSANVARLVNDPRMAVYSAVRAFDKDGKTVRPQGQKCQNS